MTAPPVPAAPGTRLERAMHAHGSLQRPDLPDAYARMYRAVDAVLQVCEQARGGSRRRTLWISPDVIEDRVLAALEQQGDD
uniref:hypothetical protein n=1 Tax=Nonomuraea sp. CA-251285 TaxID=3240002 RepID=UPI003F49858F